MPRHLVSAALGAAALFAFDAHAVILTNGSGDGDVIVDVDAFGTMTCCTGDYNPVGPDATALTVFGSAVYIGMGPTPPGRGISTGAATTVSSSATSLTTSWTDAVRGFDVTLVQTIDDLLDGTTQVGSRLVQAYTYTNTGSAAISFDAVRYLDGDLRFDGSLIDGGGRLTGGTEILFETDSATGSLDPATFVGITATGGLAPTLNRFEIDSFSGLRSRITSGLALDNIITGDGPDADSFIDAGAGYDVTMALRNVFSLAPGESTTFTTATIWGTGTPEDTSDIIDGEVPLPATLGLLGLGALTAVGFRRR